MYILDADLNVIKYFSRLSFQLRYLLNYLYKDGPHTVRNKDNLKGIKDNLNLYTKAVFTV